MAKIVNFFDGASSETVPTIGNIVASNLVQYVDEAAYEAAEQGAPATGNIYYNTTDNVIRYYNGTAWITLVDESTSQTLENKTIDGTDATGTNTVLTDASDVSFDDTVSALGATNVQDALVAADSRLDDAEADIQRIDNLIGVPGNSDLGVFTGSTITDGQDVKTALQELETGLEAGLALKQDTAEKGQPNGYASLDAGGKVPLSELPSSLLGSVVYQGTWDANGNTPTLVSGVGTQGHYYVVTTPGTTLLDSENDWEINDWVIFNGTEWEKVDNSEMPESVTPTNTVTFENKTWLDSNNKFINNTDNTKEAYLDLSNIPTATTVTYGVPAASTTFLGTDSEQVITNKDIDGGTATDERRIALPKATSTELSALTDKEALLAYDTTIQKPVYNDGSQWIPVGTGSGSGGVRNFLEDKGDAELNATTGWATYADAAQASPENGTGGTANITWTASGTSPLDGDYSFVLTKDAADRRGEGVSYDFTIDAAYKAKVLKIDFDYIVGSGTFAAGNPSDRTSAGDSDVTVWIYDVTNSVLIQPSTYRLYSNSSSTSDKFSAYFQTASNSTSYRLILHVGTTSASAYALKVDNVAVSPSDYVYGTPITDWQSYTPTVSGLGTVTSQSASWRRVGANMEVLFKHVTGTTTATPVDISLPSGYSINTTACPDNTVVGTYVGGVTGLSGVLFKGGSSNVKVFYGAFSTAYTSGYNGSNFPSSSPQGGFFSVPIAGWSSSVQMSDSADTRVVAAAASGNAASASAGNPFLAPTTDFDTHGAYNASTGRYTCPVPGLYRVSGALQSASSATTLTVYKNAVAGPLAGNLDSNGEATFTALVQCNAGDLIDLRPGGTVDPTAMHIAFERISGPSAIAATETIAAIYESNAGQSIPNATATIVDFEDKVNDTHGAVTTGASWKFTAPAAGFYQADAMVTINAGSWNAGESFQLSLYKNGAITAQSFQFADATTAAPFKSGNVNTLVYLNAGDYIDFRAYQDSGGSVGLLAQAYRVRCSIHRVGL